MEERTLLAGGIFEYPLLNGDALPTGIVAASDMKVWFTEYLGNHIGNRDVNGGGTEIPLPTANSSPNEIVQGSDGNLWFTELFASKIGRMTTSGKLTGEFSLGGLFPEAIAAGPDGRLWLVLGNGNVNTMIARMTTTGSITPRADEFTVADASEISRGPKGDNNLWFTEFHANKIGRINAMTGAISEFAVPTANSGPRFITPGPDGKMWFTERSGNKIARITTAGVITAADEFPVPPGGAGDLGSIVTGADGNLWFGDGSRIGRISPTGSPVTLFPLNSPQAVNEITKGPDNNIWFTDPNENAIGKLVLDRPLNPGTPTTITVTEGSEFRGAVAFFTDEDPTAVATDFTATIDWGNGVVSAGTVSAGVLGFVVNGTNTYGEEGSFPVKVTVTDITDANDTGGSPVTMTNTAQVRDAVVSATAVAFPSPIGTEGVAINNLVVASFVDEGGPEPIATYTATIDWGDGTPVSPGTLSPTGAQFSVTGSHTYTEEDPPTIRVTITDEGGSTITVSTPITLAEAPIVPTAVPISAAEGAPFSGSVATFLDTGGAEPLTDYAATIDWGDGTAPTAGSISLSDTTYTISGTHTYAEEGQYVLGLTVNHESYSTGLFNAVATVADAPLLASANAVSAIEGTIFQGVVASFNDAALLEPPSNYSVSIDWGNGNSSAGTLTANGSGGYDISGINWYGEEGLYPVTVTIQDEGGSSTTVTGTATVADAPLAGFGTPFTGTTSVALSNVLLAYFVDAGGAEPAANYLVSIDWGDSTGPDPTSTINAMGPWFQVTGNHTYAAAGTYAVNVTVSEDGGSSVLVTLTAMISDGAAPPPGGGGARGSHPFAPLVAPFAPDRNALQTRIAPEAPYQGQSSRALASEGTRTQPADLLFSNFHREDFFLQSPRRKQAPAWVGAWWLD